MRRKSNVPGLRLSLLVYRLFLSLHEGQFQAKFGDQMLLDHEDRYHDAWRTAGLVGVCALWFHELLALPRDVFKEFAQVIKEAKTMKPIVGSVAVTTSVLLMTVAGVIGAVVWLVLVSNGAFQNSIEQSIWFLILFDGPIAVVGLLCLGFWTTVAEAMS